MLVEPFTLEGRAIRLEPLSEEHLSGLCEIGLEEDLWELIPFRVTTPEQMRSYILTALAAQAASAAVPFATIEIASGKSVGSTRFMNIDVGNRRVEIGATFIGKRWQRTIVNTEAKYLMLRHAFEIWNCLRVELKTDALNRRSREAILRIGAREEGTLRQHMITWSGRLRDTVYFSILQTEWPGVKANLEQKLQP
ncbi:MAG: GNAT family protein [Bryobacteraceae bacterium]|jgi:RimJ/RimL family protein N-acetyltransferase